jgi:hypothetical protein
VGLGAGVASPLCGSVHYVVIRRDVKHERRIKKKVRGWVRARGGGRRGGESRGLYSRVRAR